MYLVPIFPANMQKFALNWYALRLDSFNVHIESIGRGRAGKIFQILYGIIGVLLILLAFLGQLPSRK